MQLAKLEREDVRIRRDKMSNRKRTIRNYQSNNTLGPPSSSIVAIKDRFAISMKLCPTSIKE
jgi:hypothetical protein